MELLGYSTPGNSIIGQEAFRATTLAEARDLATDTVDEELIVYDAENETYIGYTLDSQLSKQDLHSADFEPIESAGFEVIAATQDDSGRENLEIKNTYELFDHLVGDNGGELRDIFNIKNPGSNFYDLENDVRSSSNRFSYELEKLDPQQQETVLNLIASAGPDQAVDLISLFVIQPTILDELANGSLLQADSNGDTILEHMIRFVNSDIPQDLIDSHQGNEIKAKANFLRDFIKVANGTQDIRQSKQNCGVTCVHILLAAKQPAEYIRMAVDLTASRSTETLNGDELKRAKRAFPSNATAFQLMEGALNGLALGEAYNYASDRDIGLEDTDIPPLIRQVLGENYVIHGGGIGSDLSDSVSAMISGAGGDREAYQALIDNAENLPAVIGVDFDSYQTHVNNKSSSGGILGSFHVLVVEEVDTNQESFIIRDPNGGSVEEVKGSDLLKALTWSATEDVPLGQILSERYLEEAS